MTTTGSKAAAAATIGAGLGRRKRGELLERLRPHFARTGPWLQAGKYVGAVMSGLSRRNGWTIAAHVGDRTPDKVQRLLSRAVWDTLAAMGEVRPEIGRLLGYPPPPGTGHWLDWRRGHQARSSWYHQRTRLAREAEITLVR